MALVAREQISLVLFRTSWWLQSMASILLCVIIQSYPYWGTTPIVSITAWFGRCLNVLHELVRLFLIAFFLESLFCCPALLRCVRN